MTPPNESPSARVFSISSIIFSAAAHPGQRTAFRSTSSSFTVRMIDRGGDFVDLRHVCDDLELGMQAAQDFSCDRAGGDATNRFARRSAAAALPVSNSVFRFVGEIGMRRPKGCLHLRISFRTRIFVPDQNGDRRAERLALEDTGKNLAAVCFVALRNDLALPGTTPIELALDIRFADFNARRTTVDHHTDTATVRFAQGGNAKELAEACCPWAAPR